MHRKSGISSFCVAVWLNSTSIPKTLQSKAIIISFLNSTQAIKMKKNQHKVNYAESTRSFRSRKPTTNKSPCLVHPTNISTHSVQIPSSTCISSPGVPSKNMNDNYSKHPLQYKPYTVLSMFSLSPTKLLNTFRANTTAVPIFSCSYEDHSNTNNLMGICCSATRATVC